MLPVIALVGRPNVGKSTLFNVLTRTRDALVADAPGLTRDRKYGRGRVGQKPYLVVDTGGLSGNKENIDVLMAQQTRLAITEADVILLLVDAKDGRTPGDEEIALELRRCGKPLWLVVNKTDGLQAETAQAEFFQLGIDRHCAISASHGRGIAQMMEDVLDSLPEPVDGPSEIEESAANTTSIAVIGRPNVGKSTLVNRLIGEQRVLAFDLPGTTRDSIYIPFTRAGVDYTLIDTAGVRRRGRIHEVVEKFSVIKAMQAIEAANVVVLVLDAQQQIAEQDVSLLGHILESGRALVIAVNKWDGLEPEQRARIKRELAYRLSFIDYAEIIYISALHGSGIGNLFDSVIQAYESASKALSTPNLTRILQEATSAHAPPLVRGRRIKLRYAHQGGRNPPIIVIHGNQVGSVPDTYERFLVNTFRKRLSLHGTPIKIQFKGSDNPYAHNKNVLNKSQIAKRARLKRHVKKNEKRKRR